MKSLSLRYRILLPIIGVIIIGMLISGILSSRATTQMMHDKISEEIEATVQSLTRITSYNVCYTKLLRFQPVTCGP